MKPTKNPLFKPFKKWLKSDNVIKTDADTYTTQCTQYRAKFTLIEAYLYFRAEYGSTFGIRKAQRKHTYTY